MFGSENETASLADRPAMLIGMPGCAEGAAFTTIGRDLRTGQCTALASAVADTLNALGWIVGPGILR
jgi:hypothetical protein